jgi:3-deoxy-manno-octulosonate cytidylyltransferase (CMP-KDO synthetase)
MTSITGIIPTRYASTRFPGKPLADIGGKTMIHRVYEQAMLAKTLTEVIVATDDARIYDEVKSFGGNVVITSPEHTNGTERCAEVAKGIKTDVIINIQGDEPFIKPEQIDLLANIFTLKNVKIGTLIKIQPFNEELQNPARVKVVVNSEMDAMYFSRSIIPHVHHQSHFTVTGFMAKLGDNHYDKDAHSTHTFYKHVGIYGYRKDVLAKIVKLPPSPLEKAEQLEQLRWLENGFSIKCAITEFETLSIDTPEDLMAIQHLI